MYTVQVSGNFLNHRDILIKIEHQLHSVDIQRPHIYTTTDQIVTPEDHYKAMVDLYNGIASCAFHIIYCGDSVDEATCNQLLYAMLKYRPVIIIGKPRFERNVGFYAKSIIKSKLNKFYPTNLPELEQEEFRYLYKKLPTRVDYQLTHTQQVLIRSRVKAQLHELFMQTKR
ncbi:MAG TPA: hypothetical protein VD907_01645 [Verrucomicrobiae bacterium]|nr:hypothetical protein [Verrucomicrobiae bacterium]